MRKDLVESKSPYKASLVAMPEAEECYPFGEDVAVFKIKGKMFATFSLDFHGSEAMNLKCDPDQALALRDVFESVIPGYHMNKKHWNTVILDGSVPNEEIKRMIEHSYALVVKSLKAIERKALIAKYGPSIVAR